MLSYRKTKNISSIFSKNIDCGHSSETTTYFKFIKEKQAKPDVVPPYEVQRTNVTFTFSFKYNKNIITKIKLKK